MTDNINISLFGIDTPHQPDFVIDWPNGIHSYILMCFSTPFFIRTLSGIETGKPGDCILYTPDFPQYHGTLPGEIHGFRNDWLHLTGNNLITQAEKYQIPFNQIIRTGQSHIISSHLHRIANEVSYQQPYKNERIALIVEEILLLISRYSKLEFEFENLKPVEQEYKKPFIEVRSYIHLHFQEDWPINRMANMLNLSSSRFSVLYHNFFKISPKEDLIVKRIDEAKILLISTRASVEQVALDCGFKSIYYFSKIFKKRTGVSPQAFRRN